MALYESSLSPLFQRFFQPVIEAYPHSSKHYDCQELTDLDFIEMGTLHDKIRHHNRLIMGSSQILVVFKKAVG